MWNVFGLFDTFIGSYIIPCVLVGSFDALLCNFGAADIGLESALRWPHAWRTLGLSLLFLCNQVGVNGDSFNIVAAQETTMEPAEASNLYLYSLVLARVWMELAPASTSVSHGLLHPGPASGWQSRDLWTRAQLFPQGLLSAELIAICVALLALQLWHCDISL